MLKIRGKVDLSTPALMEFQSLDLEVMGDSRITMKNKTTSLKALLGGGCHVTLSGVADNAEYEIKDGSILVAKEFPCQVVTMAMSGSSVAEVNASGMLNANLSGSSELKYRGKANLVKTINDRRQSHLQTSTDTGSMNTLSEALEQDRVILPVFQL